jgi:hypothetical protein
MAPNDEACGSGWYLRHGGLRSVLLRDGRRSAVTTGLAEDVKPWSPGIIQSSVDDLQRHDLLVTRRLSVG